MSDGSSQPRLNANAASFTPNAFATEFVPSWIKSAPAPAAVETPATTAAEHPAPVKVAVAEIPAQAKPAAVQKSDVSTPKSAATASSVPTPPIIEDDWNDEDQEVAADLFGREHVNVVFIGHVDAGKSTMGGNILFLTGMVDKRTMEKYEKEAKEQNRESWYLSWALDTSAEERKKGKTVECGKAYFETEKRRYTILDAPGHKNFVPSMIGGASQADIGVLVISARKGEFETGFEKGGQTREHAVLAKTSGISKLVVAVNKMDDPTVQWSKERYDEILTRLTPFLKGTGFNPKTDIQFLPVSGFTGANLKDRMGKQACPWFEGPSLLELLDSTPMTDRKIKGPLMLPITEKYKEMGTTIVGKIESGRVKKGQTILIMPSKHLAEVTGVFLEEDEVPMAICGDNVRLRLKNVEEEDIVVGSVACSPSRPVKVSNTFEAQLAILDHKNIICAGYNAVIHIHAVTEEIQLAALLHAIDKKTNRKSKRPPPFVKKGQKVIARLETSQPIAVESFEDFAQLGRFTLRDEGKTVAIGKVTKVIVSE